MSTVPPPINRFKQRLIDGDQLTGVWHSLASPLAAEALSLVGYDWMLFDSEHAPVEVAGLLPLLQATSSGTSAAVVRPAWNDPVLVKRILDIGAQTVLVPFVQDADEARAAVMATRYPPHGRRGVAGATRASRFGLAEGYLTQADTQICCLVQIETGTAVQNVREIARVDGVDGVFIGPSDLAASMGYLGNPNAPEVQRVLRSCVEQLTDLQIPAGILATSAEAARRYRDWGYKFIAAAVDTSLLVSAAKAALLAAQT